MNKKTDGSRRDFLRMASAGAAVAGSAALVGCSNENATGDSAIADSTAAVSCPESTVGRKRFTYFGPDKDVRSSYYKFQNTPVTHIDFGLTPEQEARAAELHKTLHIFDAEIEVGYYHGLLDDIERSGAASVCGSYTIDAIPFDSVAGLDEDFRIYPDDWWARDTIESNLTFIEQMLEHEGDRVMICMNYADLLTAKDSGKIGLMLDCQNTQYIRNDLTQLDRFYALGLRRQQLSYNFQMQTASGCMEPRDGGVSKWGSRVIGKLNDLNMLVDVAHCSSQTLLDAVDMSEKPISCSHAGMREIAPDNPRTHTDEGLKKLADKGGVFGVVGVPGTLVAGSDKASVADYVNAIDRAVNVLGIDHVGFALDQPKSPSSAEWFTSPDWPPEAVAAVSVTAWPWTDLFLGLENQSGYIHMTRGLVAKGYDDEKIRKVMGGNDMRLVREVIG